MLRRRDSTSLDSTSSKIFRDSISSNMLVFSVSEKLDSFAQFPLKNLLKKFVILSLGISGMPVHLKMIQGFQIHYPGMIDRIVYVNSKK
jgi:hypothetical protein